MTSPAPLVDTSRLSLNQYTVRPWSLREVVDGCARAGIGAIGLWRDKVAEVKLGASRRLLRDTGLRVSSVNRGGFFPAATRAERAARIDDNRRAIDEAAELEAATLCLVCGPAPDRDLAAARVMVADGIAQLLPYATERGVTLGVEPLHPMFAADRSVVVTLSQAMTLVEHFASPHVTVVIDAYHVWWDPELYRQIARAAGRVSGFHISDWIVPPPDHLNGRGMLGDGVIELRRMRSAVDAAGYTGFIEVEIFNQALWAMPGDEILSIVRQRYLDYS